MMNFIKSFESLFDKLDKLPNVNAFEVLYTIDKNQYIDGELNTTRIENLPEYRSLKWVNWYHICSDEMSYREKYFDFTSYVLGDNRKSFATIFGKPSFKTGNALEFNYHCWVIQYQGFQFLLMTAGTKGTCIEKIDGINLERKKLSKVLENFIDNLIIKLKSL